MKNKNIKIFALLLIAAIGITALYRSKKLQKNTKKIGTKINDLKTLLSEASIEEPFTFSKKQGADGLSTDYVFNGQIFTKQLMGPNIKTVAQEITKSEFVEAYNAYLL